MVAPKIYKKQQLAWLVSACIAGISPALAAQPALQPAPNAAQPTVPRSETAGEMNFNQESAALLEERIRYWYERGRPDRIEGVLQQLLRVHPNSPRILEVQALLAIQQRDIARAQQLYRQLQQVAPNHPATARLHELVGLPTEQSNAIADARMLVLAGRFTQAFASLAQVFPNGPQNLELALEYWETLVRAGVQKQQTQPISEAELAELPPGSQAITEAEAAEIRAQGVADIQRGKTQLNQLFNQNPQSLRTELTMLRVKLLLDELNQADYQRLAVISRDSVYGQEAESLLVRGASNLAINQANYQLLLIARQALPEQLELQEFEQRMLAQFAAEQEQANNPFYQRKMRGLAALEADNPRVAEGWLREAQQGLPEDPEVLGGLGYATMRQGRQDEALAWFRRAAAADPESEQWQQLVTSTTFWRDVGVFDRLLVENQLPRAQIALARLQSHPNANEQPALIALREARLAAANGDGQLAYQRYYRVLALQPDNSSAAWGLLAHYRDNTDEPGMRRFYARLAEPQQAELASEYQRFLVNRYQVRASDLRDEGDAQGAHQQLLAAYELAPNNPWLVYSLALSYEQRNELSEADAVFARLQQLDNSQDTRFAYALYLARQDRDDEARESLAAIDSEQFSDGMQALALRLDERAVQSGGIEVAAVSTDLREKLLYIGFDRSAKSGTPGITELTAETLMLDLRVPFSERDGYWYLRVDPTRINAGSADLDDNFWRNRFGTGLICETDCPTGVLPEAKETGVAVGVGAELGDWWFDIGRSPIGFQRSEWVGGIGMRRSLGQFGLRLSADRRIQTATMISFSGMQDPFSERSWGAVTRNGVGLGLSWDQGGALGWWSSLGYDYYSGYNVPANNRWYGYTGGYWRAYNSEPLAITLGLTYLSWGFAKDLSQPTFGHGNYYSPELYQSVSLPITVFGRYQRFSYLLRGSIGISDTTLAEQVFYPGHPGLQEQAVSIIDNTGINPVWSDGTGGGRSHSLTGNVEYHINRSWYVGLRLNIIRSDTFSPNQGLVYLRYHFGGNNLPPARPPDPPSRYVDK